VRRKPPRSSSEQQDDASRLIHRLASDIRSKYADQDRLDDALQNCLVIALDHISCGIPLTDKEITDKFKLLLRKSGTCSNYQELHVDMDRFQSLALDNSDVDFSKGKPSPVSSTSSADSGHKRDLLIQRVRSSSTVLSALKKLTSLEMNIWWRYFVDGSTQEEIAKELDYNTSNISKIIKKIRSKWNSLCKEPEIARLLERYVAGSISTGDALDYLVHLSHCQSCAAASAISVLARHLTTEELISELSRYTSLKPLFLFRFSASKLLIAFLGVVAITAPPIIYLSYHHRSPSNPSLHSNYSPSTTGPTDTDSPDTKRIVTNQGHNGRLPVRPNRFSNSVSAFSDSTNTSQSILHGKYLDIHSVGPVEDYTSKEHVLDIRFILESNSSNDVIVQESTGSIDSISECDISVNDIGKVSTAFGIVSPLQPTVRTGTNVFFLLKKDKYMYVKMRANGAIPVSCNVEGYFSIKYEVVEVKYTEDVYFRFSNGHYQLQNQRF
jgi:hypothetical protein